MDGGESSAPKNRKRTESNGGSSDSELSEGWNIIDQTDVTSHDVPSSDGESVEVIDAEDESRGNVTDTEVEGESQLAPVLAHPPVSLTESEDPAVPQVVRQEEMFDSSFCWFLFFATAAVLVSNVAFMVAENAFAWNMDVNSEAPSFLRDLPTTPKQIAGNHFIQKIPWAEHEVTVEIDDRVARKDSGNKRDKISQNYKMNKNQPYKQSVERFEKHPNEKFDKKQYENVKREPNEKYINKKQPNKEFNKQHRQEYDKYQNEKSYRDSNPKFQKDSLNFDDHEIGRYFDALSEVATSSETRNKLSQVLLVLDALYIGLNDLEEVVTENSELHSVLRKQKYKLSQVLTEMEYGMSKFLDKVASNILNKVQKLEKRFESQWCELERRGHREELQGLFYDCQENEEKTQREYQTDSKHPEKVLDQVETMLNGNPKINMNWNSYQYQVDKDSPGKEHSNTHNNEANEVDDYYLLVKNEMESSKEPSNDHLNKKQDNSYEVKDSLYREKNYKSKYNDEERKKYDSYDKRKFHDEEGKYYNGKSKQNYKNHDDSGKYYHDKEKHDVKEKNYDNREELNDEKRKVFDDKEKKYDYKGKHNDDKGKQYNDKGRQYVDKGKQFDDKVKHYDHEKKHVDRLRNDKDRYSGSKEKHDKQKFSEDKSKQAQRFNTYKSSEQHQNKDQTGYREEQAKSEKSFVPNSDPELIIRYLKESCEKANNNKYTKLSNTYEKLKSFIDSKLRVPKKMFDSLFAKYCHVNDESYKWDKRFNRENPKGDFSGKNSNFLKDELIIDSLNKNVKVVDISEVSPEDKVSDPTTDNIILPNNKPRQWVFSYDESSHDNKSNVTGDWFFKAGESRAKMRWSHHRGDWWFERASHRRNHPQSSHWFSGRRKNWYFRRAWARQNCRHSPHDDWCDFSEDETVTVPNPNSNFR